MRDDVKAVQSGWIPHGHCTVFACDIVRFSGRPDHVQVKLRDVMYTALQMGFAAARLPLAECYREDRGDGVIVVPPPTGDPSALVHPLLDHLRGALRTHNRLAVPQARMRLRIALHQGRLTSDGNGIVGDTINYTARLLDAPTFKEAIDKSAASLGVVASDVFYRAVIEPGEGPIDPDEFRQIEIHVKETHTIGWLCLREPATRRESETDDGPAAAVPATSAGVPRYLGLRRSVLGSAPPSAAANGRGHLPAIFQIVESLMDIPELTMAATRNDIVASLPPDIAIRIPRRDQAMHDVHSIVRTCLEFPTGIERFLALVRALVGETAQMKALEDTIAELTRHPPE